MNLRASPASQDQKQSDSGKLSSKDTGNILKMIDSSDNVLAAQKNQDIKGLEFLMKTKPEIFNITPPNAKDEDKMKKGVQKYQLIQKDHNPEWRGFKSSNIT